MSESTITGKVAAISDYKEKDYFNLAIGDANRDENWYIGDGSLRDYGEIEQGDKVRIKVDDNQGSITDIDVVGANKDGETRASNSESGRGQGESNAGKSRPLTNKDVRISVGAAGNQAAEIIASSNLDPEEEQGKILDVYGELLNGFYNAMQAQVKNKTGGDA